MCGVFVSLAMFASLDVPANFLLYFFEVTASLKDCYRTIHTWVAELRWIVILSYINFYVFFVDRSFVFSLSVRGCLSTFNYNYI